jgi:FG-GAP-like repeat
MRRPRKNRKKMVAVLTALALVVVMTVTARALINPRFTPPMLVEQSTTILIVKLNKPDKQNRILLEVLKAAKGKKPTGKVYVDLKTATRPAWAKLIAKLAAERGDRPVPLFIGKYKEASEDGNAEPLEGALLQIDIDWVTLFQSKKDKNVWEMSHVDEKLQGTWDGGSDMLIKAIEYIKEAPDESIVPVDVGVYWAKTVSLGKVEGGATAAQAVSLDGSDLFALHVAARGGDRLILYDRKARKFKDITAERKLSAKSAASAWGDFNADGKIDLASWDGKALSIHMQAADGTFATRTAVELKAEGGCLGLAAVDAGVPGKAGLLVSTSKTPLLLKPAGGDKFTAVKLPDASALAGKLGLASVCLVADLDGDALYDVLQPFEKGGLVYRGQGSGKFAPPVAVAIASVEGRAGTCVGDYDMDGLLDVYMVGEKCCRLWSNKGKLKFEDVFGHSGEMRYTAQPGGVSALTNDLNNDGLQDLLIVHGTQTVHHYFNRGYRSFGKSLSIVWQNTDKVFQADVEKGQQAGTIADLNGDGAQDLALVLHDGRLNIYPQDVFEDEDEQPLSIRAVLPAGAKYSGPVTVTGWADRRCLGSWNVTPGTPGAFFGMSEPGEVKLQWKFPGGKQITRTIEVEKKRKLLNLTSVTAPATGSGNGAKPASKTSRPPAGSASTKPTGTAPPANVNWALIGGGAVGVLLLVIILVMMRKKKED